MLKDLCFEIIQACPNNCKFCSSRSTKDSNVIIDINVFKKTIEYFLENGGIEEISLSGGEPLLHPQLFEMIEYCKKKNIRTVIFTSGVQRREKIDLIDNNLSEGELRIINQYEQMEFSSLSKFDLQKLKNIGLDKIVFDFQASQVDEYNSLMGTKNLMQIELKSMLLASLSGIDIDVHYIPLKQNYKQFGDILELLNIAGIKKISILNFVPQGRGKDNLIDLKMDEKEIAEFTEIFKKVKDKFEGEIRVGIPLLNNKKHLCNAGYEKVDIKYDGTILPCPAFKELTPEQMKRYGITSQSIYYNLDEFKLHNTTRNTPLCDIVHKNNWSVEER